MMPAHDTVHIETIAHDDSDLVTVLYAHAIGTNVVSSIIRNLNPAARAALLEDLEAAQARGDNVDDVAAVWAAVQKLDMA